jgi:hypothetical protein
MFGDHLYKKGDYDAAITQYIETIHFVEPSYVIRNFLDAQRIHNLTRYLQVCMPAQKTHEIIIDGCNMCFWSQRM